MAQPFQDLPCSVVVSNNYATAGSGTLTRTTMAHLTPSQLTDLFKPSGLFADMDAWFRTSFEMKACGTKVNGMYEWLNSSRRDMKSLLNYQKVDRGPSLLFPFVLGRQDSVINTEYWAITGGVANSGYTGDATTNAGTGAITAGPLTAAQKAIGAAGDRVIRVVNRYGIDLDPKWFLSRARIFVFGRTSGTATIGQWKVLASAVNDGLTYIDVLVTSENAGSTTSFNATPVSGVVTIGGNNVNDFENFCLNRPTLDPRKRTPFWYQTMRRTRKVDSEYMKVFSRLMESNKYFQEFGDLPMAERNRQDEMMYQKEWVQSFFFGKKISANQTLANWQSLDSISTVTGALTDPGLGGKVIAKRANMVGVFEQLQACDRVRDLQNQTLNIYEFFDEIYRIVRARKSQGRDVETIDVYTDQETAARFESAFIAYLKNEYGDILRINLEEGKNELGFSWRIYKPKFPMGVKIAMITHEFFDDRVSAFDSESIASVGRFMMILDIGKGGTIYPGTIASNRKKRTLGELEGLARVDSTFACVMEHVTEENTLISETVTAVVECPANSIILHNLSSIVPTATGKVGSTTDLYG